MRPRSQLAAGACAAVAIGALGCGARPRAPRPVPGTHEVTLYRDRAVVQQRTEIAIGRAGPQVVPVRVAAGADPGALIVVGAERAGFTLLEVRPAQATSHGPSDDPIEPELDDAAATPTELELVLEASRAGRFVVALEYPTDRLAWRAAYTLTTTPARARAVLRGALSIRNGTGIALDARTSLVDAEQEDAEEEVPRLGLGVVAIPRGDTRVELAVASAPRTLRPVLTYEPLGDAPALDPSSGAPAGDPAPPQVREGVEIGRDDHAPRGLPSGPLRLFERRADGSLALLGSSPRFAPEATAASLGTVALGPAASVIGRRTRRDAVADQPRRRFTEEILITLASARPRPVEVVIREHLVRGPRWTLAYHSAPAAKEGAQQIALRTVVPANGMAKVLYVVVYTW